jgi:hypothetical protein
LLRLGRNGANYATHGAEICAAFHLSSYYDALSNGDMRLLKETIRYDDYPPFYKVSSAIVLMETGKNWAMMNLINNMFYLLILLAATYLIASILFDKTIGLIAAVLLSANPVVCAYFTRYSIDFALMGAVTLSIYLLLRSELFSNYRWSILFGISFGAGMMVKDPYAAFLIGPVSYCAIIAMVGSMGKRQDRIKTIRNIAVISAIAFIIMSPYFCKMSNLKHFVNIPLCEHTPFTSRDIRSFSSGLIANFLGLQFLPIFVLGILALIKHNNKDGVRIILLWMIVPIITVMLMPHWKSFRYVLPVMPVLVIISAAGMSLLIRKWYGKLLFVAIMGISIACTGEILGGIDTVRFVSFFSQRYIMDTSLFATMEQEKQNVDIFSSIMNAVRQRSEKDETVIFVPYQSQIFDKETALEEFFWFNAKPFKHYNIVGPVPNSSLLNDAYKNMGNIDLVLCGTGAGGDGTVAFHEIQTSWQRTYPAIVQNSKEDEKIWNNFMKVFSDRELIYHAGSIDFWLYSKANNKTRQIIYGN